MVDIEIVKIGHLPFDLDLDKITGWRSKIFRVSKEVKSFGFDLNADLDGWAYSDSAILSRFPAGGDFSFRIAIVNFPLQDNWYSRRLDDNKIVFSFHEIKDFLQSRNIPLENAILRVLYAYSLLYRRSNNRIPRLYERAAFTHDGTRGCLFDMNGIKSELVESCDRPIICSDCQTSLKRDKVSIDDVEKVKNEILKIKKPLYYRLLDFARGHPIVAILLSSMLAIFLNVSSSYIYDFIFKSDRSTVIKKNP